MVEIARIPGTSSYRLTCAVRVPAPLDEVFEFFSDAAQLEQLTPAWLRFSVLTPIPIPMHKGALIDYKLRVHGIPLRWQSRISLWDPPYRFADEQLHGPYRRWYHLHSFEPDGDGTICRDNVEYALFGGALVHYLFVRRDLQAIFGYRTKALQNIFALRSIRSTASLRPHPQLSA